MPLTDEISAAPVASIPDDLLYNLKPNGRKPTINTFMNKFYISIICLLMPLLTLKGQITVTASDGTTTGEYPTLKSTFDAINTGEHQGIISIRINASVTETATAKLKASGGLSSYTRISIMPAVACTISGNIDGPLLDLDGADSVTIDGRIDGNVAARNLTIENSYDQRKYGISTIRLINGAQYNVIRYLNLKGSSQGFASGTLYIGGTTISSGNSYNLIDHNDVGAAGTTRPSAAIMAYSDQQVAVNTSNVLTNNLIHDFHAEQTTFGDIGSGIYIQSYNTDYTITGNSIYQQMPVNVNAIVGHYYIRVWRGDGYIIRHNYIGGSEPFAGGTPAVYNAAATVVGISLETGNGQPLSKIDSNVISNFSITHPGGNLTGNVSFLGIHTSQNGIEVTDNTIGLPTKNEDITVSSSNQNGTASLTGIFMSGTTSRDDVKISRNQISSFSLTSLQQAKGNITGIQGENLEILQLDNNTLDGFQMNALEGNIYGIVLAHQIQEAQYTCTQNTIRNFSINGSTGAETSITGIRSILYPEANNTTANLIADNDINYLEVKSVSAHNGSVKGIHITPYSTIDNSFINNTIRNNRIHHLSSKSTGTSTSITGIDDECPFNRYLRIDSNIVHTLSGVAANSNSFAIAAVQGIRTIATGDSISISHNRIYNLENTSAAASWVTGITGYHDSNVTGAFVTEGNYIYQLKSNGTMSGIHLKGADNAGHFLVYNNMITLMPEQGNVYGIVNSATARQIGMYNNSIVIAGAAMSNSNSAAFYRTTDAGTTILSKNNLFYNIRTGGTGKHYTIMNSAAVPDTGWHNSNYNNLYNSPILWGTSELNVSDYIALTQQDSCSKSIPVYFTDITNGDLHLLNANDNQTLKGSAISDITRDIDGDQRHPHPAMGADEIEILLPQTTITAAGPTTFCEGDHVVLSTSLTAGIQWYNGLHPIPGATSSTYQATTAGAYTVAFSDGCTLLLCDTMYVTVTPLPVTPIITRRNNTLLSSSVEGNQWFRNDVQISGATGNSYTATQAGIYTVKVTRNNCTAVSASYAFTPCAALILDSTKTNVACFLTATGAIELNVDESHPPLIYTWSNGATTKDITALEKGIYTILVTDSLGCRDSATFSISQPDMLIIDKTTQDIDCSTYNVGAIDLTVTGGILPYSFSWSNGATTEDINNLPAGTYTVAVIDANNCKKEITAEIKQACTATERISAYPNPTTDFIRLNMMGYTGPVSLAIFDMTGNKAMEKQITVSGSGLLELNIQELTGTDYLIKIITSEGTVTRRIKKIKN